jgi:cell division transport system ATP-binding protein
MGKLVLAKNLTLGYKNEIVIKNASFSIRSGEFVFLTGVSGSGKSTLIKSMYGEVKPISGFLNIGGYELHVYRDVLLHLTFFLFHCLYGVKIQKM